MSFFSCFQFFRFGLGHFLRCTDIFQNDIVLECRFECRFGKKFHRHWQMSAEKNSNDIYKTTFKTTFAKVEFFILRTLAGRIHIKGSFKSRFSKYVIYQKNNAIFKYGLKNQIFLIFLSGLPSKLKSYIL